MGTTRLPTGPEYVPTLASTSGVPPAAGLWWGGAPGTVALALSAAAPGAPVWLVAVLALPPEAVGVTLADRGADDGRAAGTTCFVPAGGGGEPEADRDGSAAPADGVSGTFAVAPAPAGTDG
ncbi:MAG TPA: hypothetical protein VJ456_16220, partial [Acidimicrobiia bacterium]|nr:hypothetical protein [Acidimicrobiia bacterium]